MDMVYLIPAIVGGVVAIGGVIAFVVLRKRG
jgi:hypothetical protein